MKRVSFCRPEESHCHYSGTAQETLKGRTACERNALGKVPGAGGSRDLQNKARQCCTRSTWLRCSRSLHALCANPKGGCCLPAQLGEIQSALATTTFFVKARGRDHSRGPSCPWSSFGAWCTCSTELPHVTLPTKRERPRHRQLWLRFPNFQQRYRGQTHPSPGPQTSWGCFLHHCSF